MAMLHLQTQRLGRARNFIALVPSRYDSAARLEGPMSRILTAALFVFTLSVPALAGTVREGITLQTYRR